MWGGGRTSLLPLSWFFFSLDLFLCNLQNSTTMAMLFIATYLLFWTTHTNMPICTPLLLLCNTDLSHCIPTTVLCLFFFAPSAVVAYILLYYTHLQNHVSLYMTIFTFYHYLLWTLARQFPFAHIRHHDACIVSYIVQSIDIYCSLHSFCTALTMFLLSISPGTCYQAFCYNEYSSLCVTNKMVFPSQQSLHF